MKRNQIAIALGVVSIIMTVRNMRNLNKLATANAVAFEVVGEWMELNFQNDIDEMFVDIINHMDES